MKDKTTSQLFVIVRERAEKLWHAENGPEVRAALDELERRTGAALLERLERACADIEAFKRSHMTDETPLYTKAFARVGALQSFDDHAAQAVTSAMRATAENRAWQSIVDWIKVERAKPENAGRVYRVEIEPPVSVDDWDAELWVSYLGEDEPDRRNDLIVFKRGTSRLDALAHLSAWCTEELAALASRMTSGVRGEATNLEDYGGKRYHDGQDG